MIVIKEKVDEDIFEEISLTRNELKFLEKHGSVLSKVIIDDEVVNLAVRIDEEN